MATNTRKLDNKNDRTGSYKTVNSVVPVSHQIRPVSTSVSSPKSKQSVETVEHKASKTAKDTTLACRYELKYRIGEPQARAIAHYVQKYIKQDKYAQLRPGGEYPITSLYFDSDALHLCRETLEGKKNRFKLRIRGYSDNLDSPIFFEVKRRINNVIVKSRARAMQEHIPMILRGQEIPESFKTDRKAMRQFQLYTKALNAKPLVLVRYMREAYEGDQDNRVRITFDRQLAYCTSREPRVRLGGNGWQPVPVNFVVLEIKFTAKYPAWLNGMVKSFNLKQTAMSKYASSVRQSCAHGFSAPQYTQIFEILG